MSYPDCGETVEATSHSLAESGPVDKAGDEEFGVL
jgi:hypothetical protein